MAYVDKSRELLKDIRDSTKLVRDIVEDWAKHPEEQTYEAGISLLTLKNHLHLSYLQHLAVMSLLKLNAVSLTSEQGQSIVNALVRLRVTLEKIAPLELKLKYQIEKVVRRADQAAKGADDAELGHDPLAFRPNLDNLAQDDDSDQDDKRRNTNASDDDDDDERKGIYKPPRVAAVPYTEPKRGKSARRQPPPPSTLLFDSSTAPMGESTSGLSYNVDPQSMSSTARHLKRIEDYETENFHRLRMSKKDAKKRRAEEEEVAFGGLGARKGRRMGGFGGEFEDLLGQIERGRNQDVFDEMRKMKRPKLAAASQNTEEGQSESKERGPSKADIRRSRKFSKEVKKASKKK